ncbi:MAG: exo-alpha-sialidase [Asgard group archaeon]|nr:exo-alpha-sialidase [Asgard group archaeon]
MSNRLKLKSKFLGVIFCIIFIFSIMIFSKTSIVVKADDNDFMIIGFSDNILLSTDVLYNQQVEPTLAIGEDGELFAGWKNADTHNSGGIRVSFTKSIDNGETWSQPKHMEMYNTFTGQSDPWLVYYDNIIYYAYLEYSIYSSDLSQITVAKSNDHGATWTLVNATNALGFADKETMTIDNEGTIYVVYDDVRDDGLFVRLSKSTDGGFSFQEYGLITDSISQPIDHVAPYVTTNANNDVFVAWTHFSSNIWGDVFVTNSTDHGATFTTKIDINPTSENATFTVDLSSRPMKVTIPVIRFDHNERLYVLWSELSEADQSWGIFLRFSDDFGLTWSSKYRINPEITGDQWQPDMDIDSYNRLHITYYDLRGDYFKPYYRLAYFTNYTTTEITLSDAIPIASENTSASFTRPGDYFTVRVDSKDIPHVVWTDGREGVLDIYYSHGIKAELKNKALIIGLSVSLPLASALIVTMIIIILKKNIDLQ